MAKGEEFNHRNIIAELYGAGNCATEIIKATGYAKSTVLFHALRLEKELNANLMIQEVTLNTNLMI